MRLKLRRPRPPRRGAFLYPQARIEDVAKTSPGEFIRQVRAEAAKVVWPTRAETVRTVIMVLIMTSLLALFFLATDSLFSAIVRFLLSLLGTA